MPESAVAWSGSAARSAKSVSARLKQAPCPSPSSVTQRTPPPAPKRSSPRTPAPMRATEAATTPRWEALLPAAAGAAGTQRSAPPPARGRGGGRPEGAGPDEGDRSRDDAPLGGPPAGGDGRREHRDDRHGLGEREQPARLLRARPALV